MANDIKIAASMDVASFRQVDSAIKNLITSVDRLKTSMGGVAQNVQKIQTGSSNPAAPKINTQSQKGGGLIGAILGTGEGQGVNKIVNDANRAFDAVSRRISSFTDKAIRDLGRLNGASGQQRDAGWYDRATNAVSYDRMGGGGRGGFGGYGAGPMDRVDDNGMPMPAKKGGWLGGFMKAIGPAAAVAGVRDLVTTGVASLAAGDPNMFMNSTTMRAIGVSQGYNFANNLSAIGANAYNANQNFQLTNPIQYQQNVAAAVSPFRSMAQAGIGKDYSSMLAWNRVFARPDVMKSLTDVQLRKESLMAVMGDRKLEGPLKDWWSDMQLKAAKGGALNFSDWATENGRTIADSDLRSARDLERRARQEQLMAEQGQQLSAAHAAERGQMNVYTDLMANEIGQNYMGRYRTLAAAGLSSGIIQRKGRPDMTAYEYYESEAMKRGWSNSDRGANYQQVLGLGKGYGSFLGGFTLLSAGMGGFSNLGQVAKTAGMVGGNVEAAKRFSLGLAQHTVGAGGIDVAVGRDLYGGVSQAALQTGMYGASNLDWVSQNMASMIYGGGRDVAGQQRAQYGFEMGNQLNRSYTSGSRSAFDRVLSNEAAMGAAGGFGSASIDLMRLANDPRLLASVAGGAKGPAWLDSSITKEMAQEFQTRLRRNKFADVVDSNWSGDALTKNLLASVRAHGNDSNPVIAEYMSNFEKEGLGKRGSKAWYKQLDRVSTKLGRALGSDNPQADIAMIEEGFLSTAGLKSPKTNGAWRVGPRGLEKDAMKEGAAVEVAKAEAGGGAEVKGALKGKPAKFSLAAGASQKSFTGMLNQFDQGVANFSAAVDKLLSGLGMTPIQPHRARGPVVTKLP